MSGPEREPDLAAAFRALRGADEERCPPFDGVLRQARGRSRRSAPSWRPVATVAALLVLAVFAVWTGRRTAGPPAPSLTAWKSPTDFLLATPGRELLATPAGLRRSLLDFGQTGLPSSPEERRSPS